MSSVVVLALRHELSARTCVGVPLPVERVDAVLLDDDRCDAPLSRKSREVDQRRDVVEAEAEVADRRDLVRARAVALVSVRADRGHDLIA
jgi:hypothetical protein